MGVLRWLLRQCGIGKVSDEARMRVDVRIDWREAIGIPFLGWDEYYFPCTMNELRFDSNE